MAPKEANKVASVKGDQAEELILNYLNQQNRPYGATDIAANLHGAVSKTITQKALVSLHEKGEIAGKQWGKTWVYCAKQDDCQTLSKEEMEQMEGETKELKAKEAGLKDASKEIIARKVRLDSLPPKTVDLPSAIATLEARKASLFTALATLRPTSDTVAPPPPSHTPEQLAALLSTYATLLPQARQRKKIALGLEGQLMDGLEMKDKAECWDLLGWDYEEGDEGALLGGEREKELWKRVQESEEREKRKKVKK